MWARHTAVDQQSPGRKGASGSGLPPVSGTVEPDACVSCRTGQQQLSAGQQRKAAPSEADKVAPGNQPGFRSMGQRPASVAGISAGA